MVAASPMVMQVRTNAQLIFHVRRHGVMHHMCWKKAKGGLAGYIAILSLSVTLVCFDETDTHAENTTAAMSVEVLVCKGARNTDLVDVDALGVLFVFTHTRAVS